MSLGNKWEDPLQKAIKYHENFSEFMEFLGQILDFLYDQEAWKKIKPIENFIKRHIIEHFKFEEEIVFSTILAKLATAETKELIAELLKEHKILLKKIEEFQKIISENIIPPDKEIGEKLKTLASKIMDGLLVHTAKEDEQLLPILKKNRHIFNN